MFPGVFVECGRAHAYLLSYPWSLEWYLVHSESSVDICGMTDMRRVRLREVAQLDTTTETTARTFALCTLLGMLFLL